MQCYTDHVEGRTPVASTAQAQVSAKIVGDTASRSTDLPLFVNSAESGKLKSERIAPIELVSNGKPFLIEKCSLGIGVSSYFILKDET